MTWVFHPLLRIPAFLWKKGRKRKKGSLFSRKKGKKGRKRWLKKYVHRTARCHLSHFVSHIYTSLKQGFERPWKKYMYGALPRNNRNEIPPSRPIDKNWTILHRLPRNLTQKKGSYQTLPAEGGRGHIFPFIPLRKWRLISLITGQYPNSSLLTRISWVLHTPVGHRFKNKIKQKKIYKGTHGAYGGMVGLAYTPFAKETFTINNIYPWTIYKLDVINGELTTVVEIHKYYFEGWVYALTCDPRPYPDIYDKPSFN